MTGLEQLWTDMKTERFLFHSFVHALEDTL